MRCEDESLRKDLKRICTGQWQQKPSQGNTDCLSRKELGLSVQILKCLCEVRVGLREKCEGKEVELIIIDMVISKAREQGRAMRFHKDKTGQVCIHSRIRVKGLVGLYDDRNKEVKVVCSAP